MISYISKVLYVLGEGKKGLLGLLLVFSLSSVLEALGIGLIGPFISLASQPESIHKNSLLTWLYLFLKLDSDEQMILILGAIVIVVFIGKSLIYLLSKFYIFQYSNHQKALLGTRLLITYLDIDYTFHLNKNTASLINNIIMETGNFNNLCLMPFLDGVANVIIILVLLILLAKTNFLFLVMLMAVLLPFFILFNLLGKHFKKWGMIVSESQKDIIRTINNGLGGLKETKIIGCEPYFKQNIKYYFEQNEKAATWSLTGLMLPRTAIETILVIFLVSFICISLFAFKNNFEDLISVISIFAISSVRLIPACSLLLNYLGRIRNGTHSLNMLYLDLKEIENNKLPQSLNLNSKLKINNSTKSLLDQAQKTNFTNGIELHGITYCYPNSSAKVIKNLSLSIKKGQSIALIGKSGSGKTTLVDLILGLLKPEKGDIQIDGVSIYKNLRAWQNLLAYIPQSIFLMDDTIEKNIAFGVTEHLIEPDRINQAIQAAQLEELVTELPDGVKTSVGERGVRLSGGQRQRIGIARALYHKREILVLDEATSALDDETESLVSQSINALAGTKTLIIIAHRLSTVKNCDRIYSMEKGKIIKSGSYQEVIEGN